jgi:hypothetical protein
MIFQEKGTDWRLGTDTSHSGVWYLDREGMDSTLISMTEKIGVGGSEMRAKKVLILDHQRMGHPSFTVLSRLYPVLFEKADKSKFVYDTCEFEKLIRSFMLVLVTGVLVFLI